MMKLRVDKGEEEMKIKSWMSNLKRSIAKVVDWMVTDGVEKDDNWWRYNGGFPGDF